jgi:hypothetical protein
MAPEFFPFIGFGLLAIALVVGLLVAPVSFVVALYLRRSGRAVWAKRLVLVGYASIAGVLIGSAALFSLGRGIRQQYFLNEPLVLACEEGHAAEVEQLLARGASPDSYGPDFVQTALIAASDGGHSKIVALLLRSGAHLDLKDSDGKTAADHAREHGHTEIIQMLEDAKQHPPKT